MSYLSVDLRFHLSWVDTEGVSVIKVVLLESVRCAQDTGFARNRRIDGKVGSEVDALSPSLQAWELPCLSIFFLLFVLYWHIAN